jgi:hypothetical protein
LNKSRFRLFVVCAAISLPIASQADGVAAWTNQISQMMSSFKVVTKQQSAIRDQADAIRLQGSQASASAAVDLFNRGQVLKVIGEFGSTSQLVDPCYQVAMADQVSAIKGKADNSASAAMTRIYTTSDDGRMSAGGVSGVFGATVKTTSYPYTAATAQRIDRHRSRYCSVSEASSGFCTLNANGMQGGDSDFSLHVVPGKTFGWDQTEAAADFVKTIAPVRPMPRGGSCTDVECISALAERRQQEAYLSMSRFSMLRFVESRTTQATGDAKTAVTN